jgi:hypothetical protein
MQRYWKMIFITSLFIVIIGTFYIQSALAINKLPEFNWEKQAGADNVLEGIILSGGITDEDHSVDEPFTIKNNSTIYTSELSLVDRLNNYTYDPEIKKLQKKYRSFMRGKYESISNYYEDEKVLVYADINSKWDSNRFKESDFQLNVEVLYKDKDEKAAFTIDIPNQDNYQYMTIEAVNVTDGKLHIITSNDLMVHGSDEATTEVRLYLLNLAGGKLINEESIFSHSQEGDYTEVGILNDNRDLQKNNYIVIEGTDWENMERSEDEGEDIYEEVVKDRKIIVLNLKTKEQIPLEVPEELLNQEIIPATNEGKIYFFKQNKKGLEIIPYDFVKQKLEKPFEIELFEQRILDPSEEFKQIKDGKLYYAMNFPPMEGEKRNPIMYIIDLNSQELIYHGTLKSDAMLPEDYYFYMYDFFIQ